MWWTGSAYCTDWRTAFFSNYQYFLNIGGIANISVNNEGGYKAFDICAANRVLNMLANEAGQEFDKDGALARSGQTNQALLNELNGLAYYTHPIPKSLANSFGTDTVYPIIKNMSCLPQMPYTLMWPIL
ncbi:anhydro-N-acetylmuramic acid kinase [Niabella hibiscisoli]|uniref:anhydro-N-acetylmuramic acid kinase n=1 Tax=Niabella hibiscisoli TaxID=1825928 RepID=UPI00293E3536|nr:anhydro-N-acetylmuramic acid kinase [Niabella hibiscisoli]